MMPAATAAAEQTGIDPRIIVAQAALESGWGRSAPGNNFFGIKSHGQDGGQTLSTTEVIDGQTVRINDSFRTYGSPEESVQGYADFIRQNPRYRAVMEAEGLEAQVAALGASGYATDPDYAAKIMQIASSLPAPNATITPNEDGTLSGGGFDRVDVSSIIGDQGGPTSADAGPAMTDAQMIENLPAEQPTMAFAPEPETTIRTAEGRIEPRLFSPFSGPALQAYNAAAGVAYVSEMTITGLEDLMNFSQEFRGNPAAFQDAAKNYVDQIAEQAPPEFQEDLRASLTTESQRRYLGMIDEQYKEADERANNSSKALMERFSTDFAEALASGRTEDAAVARQQLENILYARESLPGIAWTREQSENLLMGAMDEAERMRSTARTQQSNEWKDQFNTIITAANDNRASDFDALVNNQEAVQAHPELAREAMAMMTVRDNMPGFMGSTPDQQRAVLEQERSRPIGAQWETDVLDAMQKAHSATVAALENDPIQYGMDHIRGAPPVLDPSTAATNPAGFVQAMEARREFSQRMLEEGWIDQPAIFSTSEASAFSALLSKDQPAELRAALAASLVSGFGPDAITALGELDADPVTIFGGQLMAAGGSEETVRTAFMGQELLDTNQVQLPTGSARIAAFAPGVAQALQGMPNAGAAQEEVTKFAQALYASKAQGIDPTSDDAKLLMEQSINQAMGQTQHPRLGALGGVQDIGGYPVLLPIGVSGRKLQEAIDRSFSAEMAPRGIMDRAVAGMMLSENLPSGGLVPEVWQNASPRGAVPMWGNQPMTQDLFRDGRVRIVAAGGNMYRMEVNLGQSVTDITTEDGSVYVFDITKLAE
jgi:hypothetical protein